MKQVAFVVEGQAEQLFIQHFIQQLVSSQGYCIECRKVHDSQPITLSIRGTEEGDATHKIVIINVENDEKVMSYISETLDNFARKGYTGVFGLRDRYTGDRKKRPVNSDVVDRLTNQLQSRFSDIRIQVTIAIEELEAWFLAAPSFFTSFNAALDNAALTAVLGYDLLTKDVESITHPSNDIARALKSVGLEYKKKFSDVEKLLSRLDFGVLYLDKKDSVPALGRFIENIDWALS